MIFRGKRRRTGFSLAKQRRGGVEEGVASAARGEVAEADDETDAKGDHDAVVVAPWDAGGNKTRDDGGDASSIFDGSISGTIISTSRGMGGGGGSGSVATASRKSSSSRTSRRVTYLKRKLEKEKVAHENTEFRLRAEIDILTKEMTGLQRELGTSLESLDGARRRAREGREEVFELKDDLRAARSRVDELAAEAEARDGLIETFSRLLLQKVGMDGGVGPEASDLLNEEKAEESVVQSTEQPLVSPAMSKESSLL